MDLQLQPVGDDKRRLRAFLDVVDVIYEADPHYVRPLDMEISDRLDERKNPFFDHGEASAWVAMRDGQPVGRAWGACVLRGPGVLRKCSIRILWK